MNLTNKSANHTSPATAAGKGGCLDPHRLVPGGVHYCRRPGFAVILWRRAQAGCRPLDAAARFNATIAAGKSAVSRATRAIHLRSGRGGISTGASTTTASNNPGSDRTAKRRAGSHPQRFPTNPVAANDGARPRGSGAKHRAAQGEPAANRQRQFESHRGLKASQEEIKRSLAKVTEQGPPKTSPPPATTQPAPILRRPERPHPQVRARPRYPREWMYDDW